jgi:hypothetical protein
MCRLREKGEMLKTGSARYMRARERGMASDNVKSVYSFVRC